jgi:hypothetical protein
MRKNTHLNNNFNSCIHQKLIQLLLHVWLIWRESFESQCISVFTLLFFLAPKTKIFCFEFGFYKQEGHFQNANQTTQTDFTINKAELKEEKKIPANSRGRHSKDSTWPKLPSP